MTDHKQETVLIGGPEVGWRPCRGDATEALGRCLVDERHELPNAEAFDRIVERSLEVVSRCGPFDGQPGSRTGLVVGYVQSGKTMSMTTVASLARDNGCRLVVLLAGVTENLFKQTARERLRPYLLHKPDSRRAWRIYDTVDSMDLSQLKSQLLTSVPEWRRNEIPEDRKRPVFLTVMKQHAHLGKLGELLRSIDLRGIPCLVIDDEADQASLDTTAAKKQAGNAVTSSTTFQRIAEIRNAMPAHTYLQYTATPQAPLLISLTDMLSPDFACVLEPGTGYTGGRAFFIEHPELVREISANDLFNPKSPPAIPPDSLTQAMREFFVGVAAGVIAKENGSRSMLVHPSRLKNDHEIFHSFVKQIKKQWIGDFRLPANDAARIECVRDFETAYQDLALTEAGLPPFADIIEELPFVLSDTPIWMLNSEDGHEVDWDQAYAHVLVGGDKLNRGFTVKGLTVTYMPRTPGSWNADTLQQRARFFGYKASYLGLCRVHLHPDVADTYQDYVAHEEDIRTQLSRYEGRPLKEWKRAFFLGHRMNPTRTNVLSESIHKPKPGHWFRQSYAHALAANTARNRSRVASLLETLSKDFGPDETHESHRIADTSLNTIFDNFIVDYECFGNDAIEWTAVALWLGELLNKNPEARCTVVNISGGRSRKRSEDADIPGRIAQLFEGRRPKTGTPTYKGDEAFRDPTAVTIQLHRLNVHRPNGDIIEDVPAIAVHLPDGFTPVDVVVQAKRGQ